MPNLIKLIVEKINEGPGLKKQIVSLQHDLDILISGAIETTGYTGNNYATASAAIKELAKKYDGSAEWGNQQVRNIIDLRAAFTIGQGVKLVLKEKEKTTRELEYIQAFVDRNDLDEEMPQEFAKEAEIEGRFLCRLIPNKETKEIDLRWISYTTNGYAVKTNAEDYKEYEQVSYRKSKQGNEVILEKDEFIYKRFSGRINKVNDIRPKVALVLRHLEDLDKALWDWRKINHLFAGPTPYFKCESADEAKKLYEKLQSINWKIGKLLVTTATYELKGLSGGGTDALDKEIISLAKIISGATGIPVHFLGLPELMSNRAVSTDLFELIVASTNKERHIWIGCYEEIFRKVLIMANEKFNGGFNPNAIGVEIPYITAQKIKELVDVWMPLFQGGVIDLDLMLSMVPNADADKIKKAQKESALKELESLKEREKEREEEDRRRETEAALKGGSKEKDEEQE